MEDGTGFGLVITMIRNLALLLVLMAGGFYALKRWGGRWLNRPGADAWIEILAQRSLGPKHYLMVVKVREQLLLVGVSPGGMHFLSHIAGGGEDRGLSPEEPDHE